MLTKEYLSNIASDLHDKSAMTATDSQSVTVTRNTCCKLDPGFCA